MGSDIPCCLIKYSTENGAERASSVSLLACHRVPRLKNVQNLGYLFIFLLQLDSELVISEIQEIKGSPSPFSKIRGIQKCFNFEKLVLITGCGFHGNNFNFKKI